MSNRSFKDRKCWLCGKYGNITHHHIIMRELKPIYNKTIPLCNDCHSRIHARMPRVMWDGFTFNPTRYTKDLERKLRNSKKKDKLKNLKIGARI